MQSEGSMIRVGKCKYQTNEIEYLEANVKFKWASKSQGTSLVPSASDLELAQASGVQTVGLHTY